ncbi:PST family polysaccharide transporter [Sinomonas atrocyanea]|nr:PST family polysaccharide transporter [Sinomonas atrocyanea]
MGIFTLAVTLHAFLTSVAELGIASAAARADLDQKQIEPTVAHISVISSLTIAAVVEIFAAPLATALGNAESEPSVRILAIGIALIGPFAVPGAVLQRDFRQDVVFRASAIAFLPGSLLLLALAWLGFGATAFAWSRIFAQLIIGLVMMKATGWPGMRLHRQLIVPLLTFGIPLALANLVSQVVLNADYIVIAHLLSAEAVGLFGIAFNVASWPSAVIGTVLNGLVLPTISRVVRDGGDTAKSLRQAVTMISTVAFPVAAFTAFFAHPLLAVLYGSRWEEASPSLTLLAAYGALFVIGLLLANALVAFGRTGSLLVVQVLALLVLAPSLIFGAMWAGLIGVAAAHAVVIVVVVIPAYLVIARRLAGFGASDLIGPMMLPAVRALACVSTAWVVTQGASELVKLLAGGILFGAMYVFVARTTLRQMVPERVAFNITRTLRLRREP